LTVGEVLGGGFVVANEAGSAVVLAHRATYWLNSVIAQAYPLPDSSTYFQDHRCMTRRLIPTDIGRLAGCFWAMIAGLGLLLIIAASGVGIDASFLLPPTVLVPSVIALVVGVGGGRVRFLVLSAVAACCYAVLGAWNYLRAEEFERSNPGSIDISGGVSVLLVVLAAAGGVWSLAGIVVLRHRATGR
jgi:hypothetical protein